MTRNTKIALGCGGAGCLGIVLFVIVCVVLVVSGVVKAPGIYDASRNSNYNYNYNSNSNSNANTADNLNSNSTSVSSDDSSSMSEDDKHKLYQAANMTGDPAHMLKSAVSVRRRLRKYAREQAAAEEARRAGIRIVQEDFGGRLIDRVKVDLRSPGRRGRACRDLFCLLQYYPAGVKTLVSDGLRRLTVMSR